MAARRRIWWAVAALSLAVVCGGLWYWRGTARVVEIATVSVGPAVELVYATGFVEAQQPVSIASRITAPVAQVLVAEGARVERGQPLVLLAADEQRGALRQATAQRRSAEDVERRTLELFRKGWSTRAARDQAVASADAARAAQAIAAARLDQLVVRADTSGVVARRDVEPGDLATPTRVLMQLGDPARVRITATVDERDIVRVRVGQAAMMSSDAWPDRVLHARVAEVTPAGDPTARAFRVRLAPQDAKTMPLGLTLEVNIVTRAIARALLAPASAVRGGSAWVIDATGEAHRRAVRTGVEGRDRTEILSGLRAGDRVIVDPPSDLVEGQKVRDRAT